MTNNELKQAAALHARGDLLGALTKVEAVVAAQPSNAAALQFLGVLHCLAGDPGEGAGVLARAVELKPNDVDLRINLARALVDAGQLAMAEEVCAVAGGPPPPDLLRMRADILKAQGRSAEAIPVYEALVAAQPADEAAWNNLGNARLDSGDAAGALEALNRAKALRPTEPTVNLNLARVLAALEQPEQALEAYQEAVRQNPQDGNALFGLGKTLLQLGRAEEALPPLGTAARLRRDDPGVFVVLGLTFAHLDNLKQAESAYRLAIQVGPTFAAAYLNLAILLERGNRVEELEALLAQAERNGLSGGEADYVRALLARRQGRLEDALAHAQASAPTSLDPALRTQFIGEVADRLRLPDTAFPAFVEMNRVTGSYPAARGFTGSEYRHRVDRAIERLSSRWYSSWSDAAPEPQPPAPAFLVGFLRSGTTLLDTILMGHNGALVLEEEPILARIEEAVGDADRLPRLTRDEVQGLRNHYFELLQRVAPPLDGRLLIDKNPLATLRAPLIHRIFPDARFIFALRHPCDVVLSCFMQNFQVNEAMASFLDLQNAALMYDRAMRFWQLSRSILPLSVHTIRYEDLVDDVKGEVRPLLDYLALEWDDKVLDHQRTAADRGYIRTPSYAQVTEGIYARASGRWTRYREHLKEVLPILAPWAEEFGYSMD